MILILNKCRYRHAIAFSTGGTFTVLVEEVLRGSDMAAGDFVRRCKQVVDLLDQIGDAAPEPHLRTTSRKAVDAVMRGVVAADRLD